MTTTTRSPAARPDPSATASGGFTLVEVLIASSLGSVVLMAVLSTFLFLGRSGANLNSYVDLERESRSALEIFAQDVRQASSISWGTTEQVTLVVNGSAVTYAYQADDATFTRTAAGSTQVLIRDIVPATFSFRAFKIDTSEITSYADLAAVGRMTKQLQISLEAARSKRTATAASNVVLSARFVLRNKRVTT